MQKQDSPAPKLTLFQSLKKYARTAYLLLNYKKITSSDSFCVLPWIHTHFFPDGRVTACCIGAQNKLGDLKRNSFSEIWNSTRYRHLRKSMLAGRKSRICRDCHLQDQHTTRSPRSTFNREFSHHSWRLLETHKDGSYKDNTFPYMDVRFSNMCNFKCRTCSPLNSHLWNADMRPEQGGGKPLLKNVTDLENYPATLMTESLTEVERIYFAGGEPLLIKDHYDYLAKLIELKRTDVALIYSTNLSKLSFGAYDVKELWSHFKDVTLQISVDGTHKHGEFIRHGMKWENFKNNFRQLREQQPHIKFRVTITVSVLNIEKLTEIVDSLVVECQVLHENIFMYAVQHPAYYSIQTIPPELKAKIAAQLENYAEKINQLNTSTGEHTDLIPHLNNIKAVMLSADTQHLLPELKDHLQYLDEKRSEDYTKFLPWL